MLPLAQIANLISIARLTWQPASKWPSAITIVYQRCDCDKHSIHPREYTELWRPGLPDSLFINHLFPARIETPAVCCTQEQEEKEDISLDDDAPAHFSSQTHSKPAAQPAQSDDSEPEQFQHTR